MREVEPRSEQESRARASRGGELNIEDQKARSGEENVSRRKRSEASESGKARSRGKTERFSVGKARGAVLDEARVGRQGKNTRRKMEERNREKCRKVESKRE